MENTAGNWQAGFSRGVSKATFGRFKFDDNTISQDMDGPRFAVVYHLLSVAMKNQRVRIKAFCEDSEFPVLASVSVAEFGHQRIGTSAKRLICTASCLKVIPTCAES